MDKNLYLEAGMEPFSFETQQHENPVPFGSPPWEKYVVWNIPPMDR